MKKNQTYDARIHKYEPVQSPYQVQIDIPITPVAKKTVVQSRKKIEAILNRENQRILMVIGPCSIHDVDAAREYARRLRELSRQVEDRFLIVMRSYFEKPRTTTGWAGLQNDPAMDGSNDINQGIHLSRRVLLDIAELGVPTGTEYLDTLSPQYNADLVSWAAIGARTVESQLHRNMVSGLSMPVGFKNGTHGHVDVAINGILRAQGEHTFFGINQYGVFSQVTTSGNPYTHIIMRGGKLPNYDAKSISEAQCKLTEAKLPENVMIDCSHGNSQKQYENQIHVFNDVMEQIRSGNDRIIGLMLESNLNAGKQQIPNDLAEFDKSTLDYGVSVTDACLSWEMTEELVLSAYKTLD